MNELTFGQRIRQLRRELDLTQEGLAEQVSYSVDTIRKLEAGSLRPSRQLAELLATRLEIPDAERADFVALARAALPPKYTPDTRTDLSVEDSSQILPLGRAQNATPDNLPAQPTSFIGREQEIADCLEILKRPEVRLLTLTGAGGEGKTRLALRIAEELKGNLSDGVFFVSLAPISDASLVIPSIIETLGLTEAGNRTAADVLKDFLREKQILLVLDNFEQVVTAAPLLVHMLNDAPRLKVLVTSREVLRLSGEHVYLVPPLSLPPRDTLALPESLIGYDAILLFLQRASAAKPGFQISRENAGAIKEICIHLDGLPLAIELAAARLRLFSPDAMLTRLASSLGWLTGGPRDLDARQQTLRATIDWSYNLLDPIQQAAFARLAVFAGGINLEAADDIAGAGFDIIASMVDKSLLKEEAGYDHEGEVRFHMLETIREYGLEKLAQSGQEEEVRNLHASYFAEVAIQADAMVRLPDGGQWMSRLETEQENIRAALAWCLDGSGDHETGLEMAGALLWYWRRSYPDEGRRWLQNAVTTSSPESPPSLVAWCKAGAAFLTWLESDREITFLGLYEAIEMLRGSTDRLKLAHSLGWLGMVESDIGQYLAARAVLDEALAIFDELGQAWDRAMGLHYSGISESQAWLSGGSIELALRHLEESHKIFVALGNDWGRAVTIDPLAWAMARSGRYQAALSLLEDGLRLAREDRDQYATAQALEGQAVIRQMYGHYSEAIPFMEEALAMRKELGDRRAIARILHTLGFCMMATGELVRARALCEESIVMCRQIGELTEICWAMLDLACVSRLAGEPVRALELYEDALSTFKGRHTLWFQHVCLTDLIALLEPSSESRIAATLLGAADALEKRLPNYSSPDDDASYESRLRADCVEAARAALGAASYARAWRAGSEMPPEQALELALVTLRRRFASSFGC